jgi:hypothetical protein
VNLIGLALTVLPMISCVGSPTPEAFECGGNHRSYGLVGKSDGFVTLPAIRAKEIQSGDIRRTQKARAERVHFNPKSY